MSGEHSTHSGPKARKERVGEKGEGNTQSVTLWEVRTVTNDH